MSETMRDIFVDSPKLFELSNIVHEFPAAHV